MLYYLCKEGKEEKASVPLHSTPYPVYLEADKLESWKKAGKLDKPP